MRVGQVAETSGLSVKTVCLYCDEGLIRAASRAKEGGYRLVHFKKTSIQGCIESINAKTGGLDSMRDELVGLLESWEDCGGVRQA